MRSRTKWRDLSNIIEIDPKYHIRTYLLMCTSQLIIEGGRFCKRNSQ